MCSDVQLVVFYHQATTRNAKLHHLVICVYEFALKAWHILCSIGLIGI